MLQTKLVKKLLALATLATTTALINGCASLDRIEPINDDGPLVCKVPYDINYPEPVQWKPVEFIVLTPERMRDILSTNPEELPTVFFALTTQGYENLSHNMSEVMRVLESEKVLLKEVEKYYTEDSNEN